MYEFVNPKICSVLRTECEEILLGVQKELKEFFTFQFYLIGSGEKALVTRNGEKAPFDLDYNLIIMRDKKELINDPKAIKELFLQAFNKVNHKYRFSFAKNSTSVITVRSFLDDVSFSFDCAIMYEGNNGNMYKIVYDKPDRYIWNEVKHTKEFNAKFKYVRSQLGITEIKALYLEKKNRYLRMQKNLSSFSILSETINELLQKIK